MRVFAIAAAFLTTAGTAVACPLCNTETGALVRAGIFTPQFLSTALAVVAPFPVLLAIVAALHFGWSPVIRRARRSR